MRGVSSKTRFAHHLAIADIIVRHRIGSRAGEVDRCNGSCAATLPLPHSSLSTPTSDDVARLALAAKLGPANAGSYLYPAMTKRGCWISHPLFQELLEVNLEFSFNYDAILNVKLETPSANSISIRRNRAPSGAEAALSPMRRTSPDPKIPHTAQHTRAPTESRRVTGACEGWHRLRLLIGATQAS